VFGYLRESKRVTAALRAFQKVRAARPSSAFLLAGDFVSPTWPAPSIPWLP